MSIEEKELQIVQATNDWARSLQEFQSKIDELDKRLETDLKANNKSLSDKCLDLDQKLISKLQSEKRSAENDSSLLSSSKEERLRSLDNAISKNKSQIADNNRRLEQLRTDIDTYVGKVEKTLRENINAERERVADYDSKIINGIFHDFSIYSGKAANYAPKSVINEDMIYNGDDPKGNGLRIASNCMMVGWLLTVVAAILINITSGVADPIGKVMLNPFTLIFLAVAIIVWFAYLMQYKGAVNKFKQDRQAMQDKYTAEAQKALLRIRKWYQEHPYYLPKGTSADSYTPFKVVQFPYEIVPYKRVDLNEQLTKAILNSRSYKPTELGSDFKFELDPTFQSLFY